MRPPVPLTPPRPRRRRKPLYFPPHTSALHSTVAVVFSEPVAVTRLARHRTAGHAARGGRDRKHRRAPPPPRAPRDRPLVSFVRAGQGTQAVPLVGGLTATRRAAPGRPPARLWKLRRLCMARSLGLGRAGVVECGRKQPGRTVGGAAAGTPLGWLVHSLRCRSKTLMCCTQRPAPGCTCRYRSLHCFRRVDWEVIMPRRCAAG